MGLFCSKSKANYSSIAKSPKTAVIMGYSIFMYGLQTGPKEVYGIETNWTIFLSEVS